MVGNNDDVKYILRYLGIDFYGHIYPKTQSFVAGVTEIYLTPCIGRKHYLWCSSDGPQFDKPSLYESLTGAVNE